MSARWFVLPLLLLLLLAAGRAYAQPAAPGLQCDAAMVAAGRLFPLPDRLLAAIGRVESGRRDERTGDWHAWPWTVNADGQSAFFPTKADAIASVRALQARGLRAVDVGCMQVDLMHHPHAFASLEEAFDPPANVAYAARFLSSLFGQTGSWTKAAAFYHSATPALAEAYQRQVLAVWPEAGRWPPGAASNNADPVRAWAARLQPAPSNRVAVIMPAGPASAMRIIPIGVAPRPLRAGG